VHRSTCLSVDGAHLTCRVAVNCAGLHADTIARLVGDDSLEVYLRKGEFFAFELPDGATLDRIPLPVPTPRTKGVLVFPTVDGRGVADPTAVDQEAKDDWTVRPDAATEILEKAVDGAPPSRASSPWPATRASGRPDAESTT
jgi:glycerol-3-phosphate dehydrogenase